MTAQESAGAQEPFGTEETPVPPRLPSIFDPRQVTPEQLPGLARIAGSAWLHSARWAAEATGRTSKLMLRSVTGPEAFGELVEGVARDVSVAAGTVSRVARELGSGVPLAEALGDGAEQLGSGLRSARTEEEKPDEHEVLREKGQRLLRQSRDVFGDYEIHPAYSRILDELAPDEAVIIEVTPPPCHYWQFQVGNRWFESLDYTYRQTSLNGHQAVLDADGVFRAVLAHRDPGVANWLDGAGSPVLPMAYRYQLPAVPFEELPTPSSRIVAFADLDRELHPATPLATPEARAEALARRRRAVLRRYGR